MSRWRRTRPFNRLSADGRDSPVRRCRRWDPEPQPVRVSLRWLARRPARSGGRRPCTDAARTPAPRLTSGLPNSVIRGSSPRRSQLDSSFVERGALQLKRLQRAVVILMFPWGTPFPGKLEPKPASKERRDPLKLAHHYQALLGSGKFESRAALARHLGVSRARVTQVLKRLDTNPMADSPG